MRLHGLCKHQLNWEKKGMGTMEVIGCWRLKNKWKCMYVVEPNTSPASLTLYSSRQTRPVTSAVVVAMAGMIFPAICRVRCMSACMAQEGGWVD